jgi:hypothetical protein
LLGLRRQSPQFLGSRRTLAQLWNERPHTCRHCRKGALIRTRHCGLACDWLLPNTCHVAFLTLSPRRSEARFSGIFESGLTGQTYLAIVYRVITN